MRDAAARRRAMQGVELIATPAGVALASDAPREDVAEYLQQLAEATRNRDVARAAAVLRAPPGGKPPIDDAAPLAQLAALRAHDKSLSIPRAAMYVALSMPRQQSREATAIRLARKFRAAEKS